MPISKGDPMWNERDVYVDYPFEEVMYRRDYKNKKMYVRFYGEPESGKVLLQDNRLLNEAISCGNEITQAQYEAK
jgi:hypothetical protein